MQDYETTEAELVYISSVWIPGFSYNKHAEYKIKSNSLQLSLCCFHYHQQNSLVPHTAGSSAYSIKHLEVTNKLNELNLGVKCKTDGKTSYTR